MNIQTFLGNFRDILDETEADLIQPETIFRDLEEWSSLTALCLIAMTDEEYSVKLTGDDIKLCKTIKDLFETINQKK